MQRDSPRPADIHFSKIHNDPWLCCNKADCVLFPAMLCMKIICRDKRATVHWSATRKRRAVAVLVVNRLTRSSVRFKMDFVWPCSGGVSRTDIYSALGGKVEGRPLGVPSHRLPLAQSPAPPLCATMPRPWYIRVLEPAGSRKCLAWAGFTTTNMRRYTGQQPGTKSGLRAPDKPNINRFVNRSSNGSLFVLPKNRSKWFSRMPWGQTNSVVSWAKPSRRRLAPLTSPRRPAVRRPAPTRPWYVRWIRQLL